MSTPAAPRRGQGITPAEDLALARAWKYPSETVVDMTSDAFWGKVARVFQEQPEKSHPRTAKTLQSRWTLLQGASQKYLAADKLYRANIPSGEVEEQTLVNVMELYRRTNKVTAKDGTKRDAAALSVGETLCQG